MCINNQVRMKSKGNISQCFLTKASDLSMLLNILNHLYRLKMPCGLLRGMRLLNGPRDILYVFRSG